MKIVVTCGLPAALANRSAEDSQFRSSLDAISPDLLGLMAFEYDRLVRMENVYFRP